MHYYSGDVPFLVEEVFKNNKIENFADLGCGDGPFLYALLKAGYLDNLKKIIAVDISQERIENVKKLSDKILCIVSDVCNIEALKNVQLDFIVSSQVIEHLPNDKKFIQEVYRLLNKEGLFFVSTVFKKWYGWYFYRCNGKWALDPTHLREYTDETQLLDILKENKFEVLKNKKTLQWFPVTDFIFKRIGLNRNIYENKIIKFLRNIKIPILGYYNWELLLKKPPNEI